MLFTIGRVGEGQSGWKAGTGWVSKVFTSRPFRLVKDLAVVLCLPYMYDIDFSATCFPFRAWEVGVAETVRRMMENPIVRSTIAHQGYDGDDVVYIARTKSRRNTDPWTSNPPPRNANGQY